MKPITETPSSAPSAAAALVLALLRGYKLLISPYFAGSCRYLPSCADYARDAVLRHGAVRGLWLAAKRLARCHPFGSHGFDPVPPVGTSAGSSSSDVRSDVACGFCQTPIRPFKQTSPGR